LTPKLVKPEELKDYWDYIKSGLGQLLIKDPDQDWIPEDVYYHIKSGKSYCMVGITDGFIDGFFVGYVMQDKTFFAWVAYCQRNLDQGIEILSSFAKQIGCKRIKFGTGRAGWDRLARKHGYKPSIWVKEI